MQISAVIISFNEEKNIERCIKSLLGLVDEIIVVDSNSTDNTKNICSRYDIIKFHTQDWLGYSSQKNLGNKLAKYDTIFSIDCDEIVSSELRESILEIKSKHKDSINRNIVFSLNRLSNYCGSWIRYSGWYPDSKIRIFHKSIIWQGDIHETLAYPSNINIINLKGDLYHYSFYKISDHILQVDKFTDLASKQAYEKGKRVGVLGIWFRPKWKFIRDYFFKLGFLDGAAGYTVCKISSFSTFLKYIKLRELYREKEF